MERSLTSVLTETLEAAQAQLDAARQLDPDRLADATASRQDLQFELEILQNRDSLRVDEEIADIVRSLRETDQRLMSVLGAANSVFRSVLEPNTSPTYGASGQMGEIEDRPDLRERWHCTAGPGAFGASDPEAM